MADFSVPADGVRPLSDDEVKRFLVANTKGDECFSCGDTSWIIACGQSNIFRSISLGIREREPHGSLVDTSVGKAEPVVTLTCTKCGFVRMHDLYLINLWLHNNPVTGKEGV
jgi:hypothetical protein